VSEQLSTVKEGVVVGIHYRLTDEEGDVLDLCQDEIFYYLHGAENIVPGLEAALLGKKIGDHVEAQLQPEEGYGEREEGCDQTVDRSAFPEDVDLEVGSYFAAESEDGEMLDLWITGINGEEVTIDQNHPMAGKVLNFKVDVKEIRAATAEELEHGHPHNGDEHEDDDDYEDDGEESGSEPESFDA